MTNVTSGMRFEVSHKATTPEDPSLVGADDIAAYMLIDSVAISTATSKAVSTVGAAAPDSSNLSIADSKGVSAGGRASTADSKAVSGSVNTSVADSKALSVSVLTSIADSKAVSVAGSVPVLTVVANSQNVSTADSKAVSVAAAMTLPTENRVAPNATAYFENNKDYNVRDYYRSGVTADWNAAMNAAIVAANAAGGGRVRIPAGAYTMASSTITLLSNVHIVGDGKEVTTLTWSYAGGIGFTASSKTNVSIEGIAVVGPLAFGVLFSSCTNVGVSRSSFTGITSDTHASNYCGGIHAWLCDDVAIVDNYFSGNGNLTVGHLSSDIQINGNGTPVDCSKRITITGNACLSVAVQTNIGCYDLAWSTISGNHCTGAKTNALNSNGYGIMTYKTGGEAVGSMRDNRIENNTILSVGGTGIYVQGGFRTAVVGNVVYDAGLVQDATVLAVGAIVLSDAADCTVSGNTIGACGKAGIAIGGSVTAEGHSITGNTIDTVTGYGIVVRAALTRSAITGNSVKSTTLVGIGTFPSDTGSAGLTIDGNVIRLAATRGIDFYGISRSSVSNNSIYASGGDGMALVTGAKNVIANNVIWDGGTLATNTYVAIDLSAITGSIISGNNVGNTGAVGYATGILLPSSCTKCVVTGNRCEGYLTAAFNVDTSANILFVGNYDAATTNLTTFPMRQQAVLTGSATAITQLLLGDSSNVGAVGTRFSGGDSYLAHNASHSLTGDLWHQSLGANASKLLILRANGDLEFYSAVAGTSDATFATFWGTAKASLGSGATFNGLKVTGTQVIATQQAGAGQAAVTLGNTDNAIGGLTISAAYSQAEVQALRAACEVLADDVRALSTLIHAMRTAGVTHGFIKGSA